VNALGKLLRAIGRGAEAAVPADELLPPVGPDHDRRRLAAALLDRLTKGAHPGDQVGDFEHIVAASRWLGDVERDALVDAFTRAFARGWHIDVLYDVMRGWDTDESRTVYTLIRDRLAKRCPGALPAGGLRP
jgi:hypothetical protein